MRTTGGTVWWEPAAQRRGQRHSLRCGGGGQTDLGKQLVRVSLLGPRAEQQSGRAGPGREPHVSVPCIWCVWEGSSRLSLASVLPGEDSWLPGTLPAALAPVTRRSGRV